MDMRDDMTMDEFAKARGKTSSTQPMSHVTGHEIDEDGERIPAEGDAPVYPTKTGSPVGTDEAERWNAGT